MRDAFLCIRTSYIIPLEYREMQNTTIQMASMEGAHFVKNRLLFIKILVLNKNIYACL